MVQALLGKKIGMTRLFDQEGAVVPVTVLQVGPCRVLQVKTPEADGYCALQLGFGEKKRSRAKKPELGHAQKAGTEPARFVREVQVDDPAGVEPGQSFTVAVFKDVSEVDVSGCTKGRGFTGVMKRWGFHGLNASRGVSMRHRAPGSIGSSSDPSRVYKGTHMAGRQGGERRTAKRLKVVSLDEEKHLLVVRGAVPGPKGGYVTVRAADRELKK